LLVTEFALTPANLLPWLQLHTEISLVSPPGCLLSLGHAVFGLLFLYLGFWFTHLVPPPPLFLFAHR